MNTIAVQPEQLTACAGILEERNEEYERNCMELFQTVEEMSAVWQGEDNAAFTEEIGQFEKDFHEIRSLCAQYAQFLRNAAGSYRSVQEEIVRQAVLLGK